MKIQLNCKSIQTTLEKSNLTANIVIFFIDHKFPQLPIRNLTAERKHILITMTWHVLARSLARALQCFQFMTCSGACLPAKTNPETGQAKRKKIWKKQAHKKQRKGSRVVAYGTFLQGNLQPNRNRKSSHWKISTSHISQSRGVAFLRGSQNPELPTTGWKNRKIEQDEDDEFTWFLPFICVRKWNVNKQKPSLPSFFWLGSFRHKPYRHCLEKRKDSEHRVDVDLESDVEINSAKHWHRH